MENLKKIKAHVLESVEEKFKQLNEYCESNPTIAEFVNYLFADRLYQIEQDPRTFNSAVGFQLAEFMYQISPIASVTAESEVSWFEEILYFIGNYFMDDCYFVFTQDKKGFFVFGCDNDGGYQDPLILIEAAKAHVKYYDSYKNLSPEDKVDDTAVKELLKVYEL